MAISEMAEELLYYLKCCRWITLKVAATSSICDLRVTTLLATRNFFLIELLQTVSQEDHTGMDPGYYLLYGRGTCSSVYSGLA